MFDSIAHASKVALQGIKGGATAMDPLGTCCCMLYMKTPSILTLQSHAQGHSTTSAVLCYSIGS